MVDNSWDLRMGVGSVSEEYKIPVWGEKGIDGIRVQIE
jgi:hypothetical protein